MTVIGNDLVSVSDTLNKQSFLRTGIDKFFSKQETDFIKSYPDMNTVACIWAMKESAYKCHQKLAHNKAFSPAKYCVLANFDGMIIHGKINYGNTLFYAHCIDDGDHVKCKATNKADRLNSIKSICLDFETGNNKNEIIAREIQKYIDSVDLTLIKTHNNIPLLVNFREKYMLETSISNENNLYYISVLPVRTYIPGEIIMTEFYTHVHSVLFA
ncbi:MAG: 4'-phosphopantetheinyl transferase superfamily protein [Bacteroidales bacterium]